MALLVLIPPLPTVRPFCFPPDTRKHLCDVNTPPDTLIRSLFYAPATGALITVAVHAAEAYTTLRCVSLPLASLHRALRRPPFAELPSARAGGGAGGDAAAARVPRAPRAAGVPPPPSPPPPLGPERPAAAQGGGDSAADAVPLAGSPPRGAAGWHPPPPLPSLSSAPASFPFPPAAAAAATAAGAAPTRAEVPTPRNSPPLRALLATLSLPLFPHETLTHPGFVEFDAANGAILTHTAPSRYTLYCLASYAPRFRLPASPAGLPIAEVKLSPGAITLLHGRSGATGPLCLTVLDAATGAVAGGAKLLLGRRRVVELVEPVGRWLLLKQSGLPLEVVDVRGGGRRTLPGTVGVSPEEVVCLYGLGRVALLRGGGGQRRGSRDGTQGGARGPRRPALLGGG